MLNNYPPGVTGNEPQITGEWPCKNCGVILPENYDVCPGGCSETEYAWARGTRIRSLNWSKEYGIISGYDTDLQMNLVKWDSGITEAVEHAEFEVIR